MVGQITDSVNISHRADIAKTLTREPRVAEPSKEVTEGLETAQNANIETPVEPTPSELVGLGRPPYIVDLMDCRMAYETFDFKDQVAEIDEYIRSVAGDTRQEYEQSLNGLKTHIQETGDIYKDVEQLRDYIRIQTKIKEAIKAKEDFEAKDPLEMNTSELRRYIDGGR